MVNMGDDAKITDVLHIYPVRRSGELIFVLKIVCEGNQNEWHKRYYVLSFCYYYLASVATLLSTFNSLLSITVAITLVGQNHKQRNFNR